MNALEQRIATEIRDQGPLPFSAVVEAALYDDERGFYAAGGAAGRRGDFLTSPEVGPLFAAVIARALDAWWRELAEPDPFLVIEAGAGRGALATAVIAAAPACHDALRYVLVERSAALRASQRVGAASVASLREAVITAAPAVVLANELLDNLPFDLAERTADGWHEVRVDVADRLVERLAPLDAPRAVTLDHLAPNAALGARVPIQTTATAWLGQALTVAGDGGRVVVIDYATTTADLAQRPWREWVRTYRGHARGGEPLAGLGSQDITCEVAVDQLAAVRPPDVDRTQAAFLVAHGLDDLVEEGRRVWRERAHIGDLEAIRARSRIGETEALTDPSGLGAFRVLEWR